MTVAYLVGGWPATGGRESGCPSSYQAPCSLIPRAFSFIVLFSFHPLCLRTVPLIVVEANPVTPRRVHPETDDKVHPATPAYTARVPSHTRVHMYYTHIYIHTHE